MSAPAGYAAIVHSHPPIAHGRSRPSTVLVWYQWRLEVVVREKELEASKHDGVPGSLYIYMPLVYRR